MRKVVMLSFYTYEAVAVCDMGYMPSFSRKELWRLVR